MESIIVKSNIVLFLIFFLGFIYSGQKCRYAISAIEGYYKQKRQLMWEELVPTFGFAAVATVAIGVYFLRNSYLWWMAIPFVVEVIVSIAIFIVSIMGIVRVIRDSRWLKTD